MHRLRRRAARLRILRSIEQSFVARGYKRGKRRGLKQGLADGREAFRGAVHRVLVKRFKRVPADAKEQLATADFATLTQWLETALVAKTLKDVFRAH